MPTRDKVTGRFIKTLKVWNESNWEEGWYDNRGRFRVYRPDYPKAFPGGYALRAWVVYWLHTGQIHPSGTNLHHINRIKDDDRFENLQVIEHSQHSFLHNFKPSSRVELICLNCKKPFCTTTYKINGRKREGQDGIKFCSQFCYHTYPKSESTKSKLIGRKHTQEEKDKMSKSMKETLARKKANI